MTFLWLIETVIETTWKGICTGLIFNLTVNHFRLELDIMTKSFILYISGMQAAVALGETVIKLEEVSHLVLTSSVPEIVSSPN